jgi:hypothetical protein
MVNVRKKWFGNLNLPEGSSGKFRIKHEKFRAGYEFQTASARTMIFAGHKAKMVAVPPGGATINKLLENGNIWMSDVPIEQAQIDPCLKKMYGNVLVGGLGLGYAAQMLASRDNISHVTIVEKSQDVINLVADHLEGKMKMTVYCADLHEWLVDFSSAQFDAAFYDIWASDGCTTLLKTVTPLRKMSSCVVPSGRVFCWNEDVMRGQMLIGIQAAFAMIMSEPTGKTLDLRAEYITGPYAYEHNASVPLFRGLKTGSIQPGEFMKLSEIYVKSFGIPGRMVPV